MLSTRPVDSALVVLLRTKEGTQEMTGEDLAHFNALKCSIFKCRTIEATITLFGE